MESYIGALFVDSNFDFGEVERFFNEHIRWFFEDMNIYDTYANNHPTVSPFFFSLEDILMFNSITQTYLHNLLSLSFGCSNYRIMASEVPAIIPGGFPTAIAAVMIHDEIVAEGTASSGKNAKVKLAATPSSSSIVWHRLSIGTPTDATVRARSKTGLAKRGMAWVWRAS